MRLLTHFLRSSNLSLNSCFLGPTSFGDHELLASVSLVPPQRRRRKLKKKNTFSALKDFTLLRWHSGTKRVGRARQRDLIDNEAGLFWKSIVKPKHQSLISLALMRLVPGADRVIRHICIRCVGFHFYLYWGCREWVTKFWGIWLGVGFTQWGT